MRYRSPFLFCLGLFITACHSLTATSQEAASKKAPDPSLPVEWGKQIDFRSIGPANMSGRIVGLAINPNDTSQWWAASASGGLLRTDNNGATFAHQFDSEATVSIGAVDISKSDPKIIWIGTGEENPRNSSSWGDGVYKSTDGGETWTNMGLKTIFQTGAVAIHPTNPDVVYVGALGRLWGKSEDRGLYKTTDGGKNWKKVLYVDDSTGVIDIVIHPQDPNVMLAATYCRMRDGFDGNDPAVKFGPGAGIWRSTDGGETWVRIQDGLPKSDMGRIGLCFYEKDPNFVYAVIESKRIGQWPEDSPYIGVRGENVEVGAKLTDVTKESPAAKAGLKSGDIVVRINDKQVLSYNDMTAEVRRYKAGDKIQVYVVRDSKTETIEVSLDKRPTNNNENASENSRNRREASSDQSQEPSEGEEEGSAGSENAKLEALRRGSPFAQSLGGQNPNMADQQGEEGFDFGGIYRSTDAGATWTRINSLNPRPMYYSKIAVDPSDNNYIWVLGTALYLSNDGGQTFTEDGAGAEVHVDHHAFWIDPKDGRHAILGCDGGIYVTYDRGKKWDHLNHVAIGQFYHVGLDTNRDYKVYGGLQDNGSWGGPSMVRNNPGPVNTDWFRIGGGDGFVCLVDPDDPNQLYYESQNGAMGRRNLLTGETGGIRPRPPRGVTYRFNWKTPFILSPHNSEIHFSAGNYVFRSIKKGADVQAISPEITRTSDGSGSAIGQSPVDENILYAGTTDGMLWVTKDGGKSWIDLWNDGEKLSEPASEGDNNQRPRGPTMGGRGPGSFAGRGAGRLGGGPGSRGPGMGRRAPEETTSTAETQSQPQSEPSEQPKQAEPPAQPEPPTQDAPTTTDEPATPESSETPKSEPPAESAPPADPSPESPQTPESTPATQEPVASPESTEASDPASQPEETSEEAVQPSSEEKPIEAEAPAETAEPTTPTEPPADAPEQASAEEPKVDTPADSDEEASKAKEAASELDLFTGTWNGKLDSDRMPPERAKLRFAISKSKDGNYVGEFESGQGTGDLKNGRFNAQSGSFSIDATGGGADIRYEGSIVDGKMTGTLSVNEGAFTVPFTAEKVSEATELKTEASAETVDDGSKPLKELLPKQMWISSISPSNYVAGRCYVTIDGHRSDVDGPFVLVTENFGQTWRRLDTNLPEGTGAARVIREDIVNRDLLYLGTEFALFVSIDRGETWTDMRGDLPTVAIHEVAQHPTAGEIVLGTHGRSLWIADVTALRQWTADAIRNEVILYQPNDVIRWRSMPTAGDSGTRRFVGENPSGNAEIFYSLPSDAREIELEIRDIAGTVIQRLDAPAQRGLHKISWDLRRRRSGNSRFGGRVENGQYLIVLSVDGKSYTKTLSINSDPEFPTSGRAENEAELIELLFSNDED